MGKNRYSNEVLAIPFGSLKTSNGSLKTSNGSLKASRKDHRKLQERITENFKWVSPNLNKKTWETPGGVPTYRRAFYVGSVGCLQRLLMPDFCQSKNLPSFLSY
jgi:hypothetical protein